MSARHINWFLPCVTILRESGSIYIFGEYSFKKKSQAGSRAFKNEDEKKAQKIFESGFQSKFMLCCNFFFLHVQSRKTQNMLVCVWYQNRNTKMHKCRLCDTKLSKLESQKCVNWFLFLFSVFMKWAKRNIGIGFH